MSGGEAEEGVVHTFECVDTGFEEGVTTVCAGARTGTEGK